MDGVSNDAIVYFGFSVHFPNTSESDGDLGYTKIDSPRSSFQSWLSLVDLGFVFIIA